MTYLSAATVTHQRDSLDIREHGLVGEVVKECIHRCEAGDIGLYGRESIVLAIHPAVTCQGYVNID
jgi:hypothetical protein